MSSNSLTRKLLDFRPSVSIFLDDVVTGLSGTPRRLPSKYFYDRRGSRLFDAICDLDEYYLTRTELAIMRRCSGEMAAALGPQVLLVEYGSGSSVKTRWLLDHLDDPVAYVPVDISRRHLLQSADDLREAYPQIEILPVCADFTTEFRLPATQREASCTSVFFPGSTIGNLEPVAAMRLLRRMAALCGEAGELLIGIDLKKDRATIEAAYNDQQGVTADFNLNLLRRMNRELEGDFDLKQFRHQAIYDEQNGRVEMYLVSAIDQVVTIGGHSFDFPAGESICTEYSHKYTVDGFAALAAKAGWELRQEWSDSQRLFAVLHLIVIDCPH